MRILTIFLLIAAFFGAIYYGFITLVGKTMHSHPTYDVSTTTSSWQSQSQKAKDLQQTQRDLMEQRRERMRDLGHR